MKQSCMKIKSTKKDVQKLNELRYIFWYIAGKGTISKIKPTDESTESMILQ